MEQDKFWKGIEMRTFTEEELKRFNRQLKGVPPADLIQWVVNNTERPVVTTNFRPYEVAILHACSQIDPNIKVVWCDTGYNTPNTYLHAREVIELLQLNVKLYTPQQTAAYRNAYFGGIPQIDSPLHEEFTNQVKLEPFQRAIKKENPDVWFTNLRQGQTTFRDGIGILSYSKEGLLKVSPFYHWTDEDLDTYLRKHELPNEFNYFDPTKALANRECGLHA